MRLNQLNKRNLKSLALSAVLAGFGVVAVVGCSGTSKTPLGDAGDSSQALAPAPTLPPPTALPPATAVPTATPPFPLAIDFLRQRDFPAGPVTLVEKLAPGRNYQRSIVSYQSDGLRINALMTVPNGDKPATGWPVVIFNHGYIPPAQYRTTERYVAYVDGFARAGYIVFRSDYRGHDESEGEPSGAYGSPDYTIDVLNALAAMKAYPDADPSRIGMWGHSMGGYITLRSMVVAKDIKAGVIWAGVVASYPDLFTRWRRPGATAATPTTSAAAASTGQRRWRESLIERFGSPESNPDFWTGLSANSFLAEISGPVQLHHGTADHSVPLEFSELLDEQLKAAGQSVELFTYPGDDHNLSKNLSLALRRSVAFFDKHVKGEG